MTVTIYHNPRCSKSRATLALLQDRDVTPDIVHYLETPPSKDEMNKILDALGMEPRDLMRKKEEPYKALNLDDESLGRDALIDAMLENPILIERPVVVNNGKYALGRPPENVLDII
jgi:arsenate reductase